MDPSKRIVASLPLTSLWRGEGELVARRQRDLSRDELRDLLRLNHVTFVVAEAGKPLRWISAEDTFAFWRREAQPRIADPAGFVLEDFPDSLAYVASRWDTSDEVPIVLLESHH